MCHHVPKDLAFESFIIFYLQFIDALLERFVLLEETVPVKGE